MRRFAAPVLGLALFAALAVWLHRFDPASLLDAAAPGAAPRPARAAPARPLYLRAIGADTPVSVTPLVGEPGRPLRVRCRAEGALAGAARLSLRWSERGGPESVLPLAKEEAGAFGADLVPGPGARGLRLICFDPERPAASGWAAAVHLAAPESIARLPRFDRARAPSPALTGPAEAQAAMPGDAGTLRFDRLTETGVLLYYWRTVDADAAGSENRATALDAAAVELRDFLGGAPSRTKSPVYVRSCLDCAELSDPRAEHGHAWRDAVMVAVKEHSVVKVGVHELTHHLSPDVERCTTRPALCEGLAVFAAAAHSGGLGALEEDALAALPSGRTTDLLAMDAAGFYGPEDVNDVYTLSGALVLHLVERHGARAVVRALDGVPLEEAFGASGPRLEERWLSSLRGL